MNRKFQACTRFINLSNWKTYKHGQEMNAYYNIYKHEDVMDEQGNWNSEMTILPNPKHLVFKIQQDK